MVLGSVFINILFTQPCRYVARHTTYLVINHRSFGDAVRRLDYRRRRRISAATEGRWRRLDRGWCPRVGARIGVIGTLLRIESC